MLILVEVTAVSESSHLANCSFTITAIIIVELQMVFNLLTLLHKYVHNVEIVVIKQPLGLSTFMSMLLCLKMERKNKNEVLKRLWPHCWHILNTC